MKNIKDAVSKAMKNVRNAMNGTISSILKSEKTVFIKLYEEEEIRDVKIISPYGFFSLPLQNSKAQVIFNNTNKRASIVGVEHETPIEIDIGESLIYNNFNSYIHLKKDGKIYIKGETVYGNGTKNVARVGDSIEVVVEGITYTGVIKTGTSNIKA